MSLQPSDALVFFGAMGDLAYKKTFPPAMFGVVVEHFVNEGPPVYEYKPNTPGSREGEQNTTPAGGWHDPVISK